MSGQIEEISTLLFKLDYVAQLLKETYQIKETFMEKVEKHRVKEAQKRRKTFQKLELEKELYLEKIDRAQEEAAEEIQRRQIAEQASAEEIKRKAELEKAIKAMLLPICCQKLQAIDPRLEDAIGEKGKETILQAAIEYESASFAMEVIDALMEEIERTKAKIIEERQMDPALIERALINV